MGFSIDQWQMPHIYLAWALEVAGMEYTLSVYK